MYILAIDEGTTGTSAIIFNEHGQIVSRSYQEFPQFFPKPGWVEHDPELIWKTVQKTIGSALEKGKINPSAISAIGITNQRETSVLWNRKTDKPVYNAIVWQCRRTANLCEKLKERGLKNLIREKTGLPIDAYFSATKIKWILDNVSSAKKLAKQGSLVFGTIDTWLLWKLTDGKSLATDYTNASRTMLFNIKELKWDAEILKILGIPSNILPEVFPSIHLFGKTKNLKFLPDGIPIYGIAGDQQAALFGQTCFNPGEIKNTYGTGCFILLNLGSKLTFSKHGLITTMACGFDAKKITYALEGSVFIAGAVIQWLRDQLKIIGKASETEQIAKSVKDSGGIYFVPAFVGLGAPYWNMQARGNISGLTRGTNQAHIVRAALEAIAFQTKDVVEAMEKDAKIKIKEFFVDGKACQNNFLMQFQADILPAVVKRPKIIETTAQGAAYLAGIGVGIWKNEDELRELKEIEQTFKPQMMQNQRKILYEGWKSAVKVSMSF